MRVFLDANVIFSASAPESGIGRLLQLARPRCTLLTSDFAAEEARRNVELKRPDWAAGCASLLEQLTMVPSILFPLTVELDEKDRPILCAAIRSKCDFLVTGDRKHFGHWYDQEVDGVAIVSVLGFAQRIAASDLTS